MKRFKKFQRVRITDPEHPMTGRYGTVESVRSASFFVVLDTLSTTSVLIFHDDQRRGDYVELQPEQCEVCK